ncbi:nucleotide disphospho-sugar-binding domain-containing protein [Stomatobaculum longum]|uniref:nucleotide disphospho-sugar-binding domain-containing protein n=1 Tax=Stomatobaculum longum TaxID=796942 RepID=UPI0028038E1E|nr:nucleotide disphospho-sugar-binding domain-containing protein [Stomatobaculum longum]
MKGKKRHILMVNLPYAGHTNPSLGLVRCLVAAGHEVDYIQAEAFRERVEASGARFVPYDEPPQSLVPALNEIQNWGAAYRTVRRIGANYDCLIYELLFFPGKALAAELGIPCYRLISTFALNRHLLRVLGQTGGPYLTALFRSERLCTALSRLFLPKFSLREKNLAEALVREAPPHNFIYTLRDFQPEEACFPETNYHFVGPAVDDRAEEPFSFGKSGNPIVYISFGTLMHADKRFWKKLIAAFAGKRVEVVCSVGSEKLVRALGDLPPNVRAFAKVPQLTLLCCAALFVTHGGMNSVNEALYYGVPMIVLPFGLDQPLVGRELQRRKLGRVIAPRELTAERLWRTAKELLRDPEAPEARLAMKRKMRASGGNREVTRRILEDLAARDARGTAE